MLAWAVLDREEHKADWDRARNRQGLAPINPLDQDSSMVRIASVRCLEGFTVELGFTDGTRPTLDLYSLIQGAGLDPDVLRWDLPVVAPGAR